MNPKIKDQSVLWDEIAVKKQSLPDAELRISHEREIRWYRWFLLLLPVKPGDVVLDCGCGDGFLSVELARRGAIVTGFDISESAIEVAKRRALLYGVSERTRFISGSFENLNLEGSQQDGIYGIAILHHVNTEIAAQKIKELLKPGRRAIFMENSTNNGLLMWIRTKIVHN